MKFKILGLNSIYLAFCKFWNKIINCFKGEVVTEKQLCKMLDDLIKEKYINHCNKYMQSESYVSEHIKKISELLYFFRESPETEARIFKFVDDLLIEIGDRNWKESDVNKN